MWYTVFGTGAMGLQLRREGSVGDEVKEYHPIAKLNAQAFAPVQTIKAT